VSPICDRTESVVAEAEVRLKFERSRRPAGLISGVFPAHTSGGGGPTVLTPNPDRGGSGNCSHARNLRDTSHRANLSALRSHPVGRPALAHLCIGVIRFSSRG
jgi:hypothetical protein